MAMASTDWLSPESSDSEWEFLDEFTAEASELEESLLQRLLLEPAQVEAVREAFEAADEQVERLEGLEVNDTVKKVEEKVKIAVEEVEKAQADVAQRIKEIEKVEDLLKNPRCTKCDEPIHPDTRFGVFCSHYCRRLSLTPDLHR